MSVRISLQPSKCYQHNAALQTASVTADDRLMKRVQSLPAGWFCTSSKKQPVMSGWFQRAGGHTNTRSVISECSGNTRGGNLGGATYLTEHNMEI